MKCIFGKLSLIGAGDKGKLYSESCLKILGEWNCGSLPRFGGLSFFSVVARLSICENTFGCVANFIALILFRDLSD